MQFSLYAQSDTVKYKWPVAPLNESQGLTATFCEFRNTLSSDHFHNAVDISEPDGNPVYPCISGTVHSIVSNSSNSYVRVRTNINGKWKHLTYLHILPNPDLYVGQNVVASETILGSIYSGMGHVHLIERELVTSSSSNGAAINNVREGGGLTPYNDSYTPVIHGNTLKFYINDSNFELPHYGLSGKVDIKIKIEERNGTSTIHRNNGTYLAGYRILSEDTSTVVHEPFADGTVYKFDREPVDADVHNVFVKGEATLSNPVYWITNGEGADVINSSLRVRDNYFDADLLPEGNYILEIFTEDTRRNFSNKYFSITISDIDLVPPGRPVLLGVLNPNGNRSVEVFWDSNKEPDIKGYRLYYSVNTQLSTWALAADETVLADSINSFYFESPAEFNESTENDIYFFYLTAVDTIGNESEPSDIYSRSSYTNGTDFPTALIVDGFDRYGGSGSWQQPVHSFNRDYFIPITISDSVVISSAANEAVLNNLVSLDDYDMVIWFTGDESTVDNTFTSGEQGKLAAYLDGGGNLFVSGSEIGWDLDRGHSNSELSDTLFYRHYLKSRYIYDGSESMNKVNGKYGTAFESISLNIGQVYEEDWPDDIDPANGSSVILNYNQNRNSTTPRNAGVAYTGVFRNGSEQGKMIYLSFALETTYSLSERADLMSEVLNYFDITTAVNENSEENIPAGFLLSQNYPNPFNPATTIEYSIPVISKQYAVGSKQKTEDGIQKSENKNQHQVSSNQYLESSIQHQVSVSLKVYDILGREVATLVDSKQKPGAYKVEFSAGGLASGIYFYSLRSGNYYETKKMMLLK
jgi:hypothetical protein